MKSQLFCFLMEARKAGLARCTWALGAFLLRGLGVLLSDPVRRIWEVSKMVVMAYHWNILEYHTGIIIYLVDN